MDYDEFEEPLDDGAALAKRTALGRNSAGRSNGNDNLRRRLAALPFAAVRGFVDVDRACTAYLKSKGLKCGGFADYRYGPAEGGGR